MKKTLTIDHSGLGGVVRVAIDTPHNMAQDAARILSQREFGRRGTCVCLRLDSWGSDGKTCIYQAFIGRSTTQRDSLKYGYSVTGHNVWIYVCQK